MEGVNGIGSTVGQVEALTSALLSSSTSRRRTELQVLRHRLQGNGRLPYYYIGRHDEADSF